MIALRSPYKCNFEMNSCFTNYSPLQSLQRERSCYYLSDGIIDDKPVFPAHVLPIPTQKAIHNHATLLLIEKSLSSPLSSHHLSEDFFISINFWMTYSNLPQRWSPQNIDSMEEVQHRFTKMFLNLRFSALEHPPGKT